MAHSGQVSDPQYDAPDIDEALWEACETDVAQRMTESLEDVCEELWRPDDSVWSRCDELIVALASIINSPRDADCGAAIAEAKRLMLLRMGQRVRTDPELQARVRTLYYDVLQTRIDEAAHEAALARWRDHGDDE